MNPGLSRALRTRPQVFRWSGGLTIPDKRLHWIYKKYAKLRVDLPKERGEVKGRLLSEPQVAAVVDLLRKNECLLELVAIDANMHEAADVAAHREGQARGMTSALTDAHQRERLGMGDRAREPYSRAK